MKNEKIFEGLEKKLREAVVFGGGVLVVSWWDLLECNQFECSNFKKNNSSVWKTIGNPGDKKKYWNKVEFGLKI